MVGAALDLQDEDELDWFAGQSMLPNAIATIPNLLQRPQGAGNSFKISG